MNRSIARLAVYVLVAAGVSSAATQVRAQWGDLTVKFVYDGAAPTPAKINADKDPQVCGVVPLFDESLLVDSSGGIANVVLYVRTVLDPSKINPEYKATDTQTQLFDNKGCRFEPHVLVMRLTQPLELKNNDPVGHNSNLQPLGDTAVNPLLPPGGQAPYKFNKKQSIPQQVTCNIHPWMKGYILPRDNPYAAVSAPDGTLTIKNLPTGDLEFQAWHEKAGYIDTAAWPKGKFTHNIKAGANDLSTIKLDAKLFNK